VAPLGNLLSRAVTLVQLVVSGHQLLNIRIAQDGTELEFILPSSSVRLSTIIFQEFAVNQVPGDTLAGRLVRAP